MRCEDGLIKRYFLILLAAEEVEKLVCISMVKEWISVLVLLRLVSVGLIAKMSHNIL